MQSTKLFELTTIDGRGRSFLASDNIKAGSELFSEEPYSHICSSMYLPFVCAYCCILPESNQVFATDQSDSLRYCSIECMMLDREIHEAEKLALLELDKVEIQGNSDPLRLVVRLACMKKIELKSKLVSEDPAEKYLGEYPLGGRSNSFEHVMLLNSATEHLDMTVESEVRCVAEFVSSALERGGLVMSNDEVFRLIYIIQCNAHSK
jgi:hypothetical protein